MYIYKSSLNQSFEFYKIYIVKGPFNFIKRDLKKTIAVSYGNLKLEARNPDLNFIFNKNQNKKAKKCLP
jgi:hypothetical protein